MGAAGSKRRQRPSGRTLMSEEIVTNPEEASILFSGYYDARSDDGADGDTNGQPGSANYGAVGGRSRRNIDFLNDHPSEMTYGRRIALSMMSKKWYNPAAGEEGKTSEAGDDEMLSSLSAHGQPLTAHVEKPSLERAWAYFEHVALSRYIVDPNTNNRKSFVARTLRKTLSTGVDQLDRAEPGEKTVPTKLYAPFATPHSQLGDFGLGLGLYFSTLRGIAMITFIAGCINLPNMIYFASSDYSDASLDVHSLPFLVEGSAICSDRTWVPCPDCDCAADAYQFTASRCAFSNETGLPFALKNNCEVTERLGLVNYITMIVVLISTMLLSAYLRKQEVEFDEDEQTAQDYAVVVENPPEDANDPDEWKQFFKKACDARVTVCTVAVDNDILVRTLVERRELLRKLQYTLEPGTSLDVLNLARIATEEERDRKGFKKIMSLFVSGIPEQFDRLVALDAKVQGLAQLDYPVTRVFLIFETEADQRKVLSKLSVGSLTASRNNRRALKDPKYLFRGNKVLMVDEPDEPNTIRWQDLNAGYKDRLKQQFLTCVCTVLAIVAVVFLVNIANHISTFGSAFAISGANVIFPMLAKALTDMEAHGAEGSKQTSLYFKIAAFRWVNTAFVITIITPFTDTICGDDGVAVQAAALFFADIVTTNSLQLADPTGHINRHLLAPRATSQDAMNLMFQGEAFELAERYTNMTKLLFLALWYCALFPGAFFLCSIALFISYYVDRFSLMRTWKRPPHLGTDVSKFSRRYFFSLACVAMAVLSSYYWSGFPYDNLCQNDTVVSSSYVGDYTITAKNGDTHQVSIVADDTDYRYCRQNLIGSGTLASPGFPFIPSKQGEDRWMTEEQETITFIYGWSTVAVSGVVAFVFFLGWLKGWLSLFRSSYKSVGDDMGIPFSQVPSINAYIPQVESAMFSYPLLAADSDVIDEELYDWNDPERPFSYYDLTKDADELLHHLDMSSKVGFSIVKHWLGVPDESDSDDESLDD